MRIVSYNILDGGEGRADPLAEVIEAQRPDVVALIEAIDQTVVERVANRLKMDFIIAVGKKGASALLSRWPIAETINHAMLRPGISKSFLEAVVIEPQTQTRWPIGVIHLHAHASLKDEKGRMGEMARVLDAFSAHRRGGQAHLLCGDFNAASPADTIDPERMKPRSLEEWKANGNALPREVIQSVLSAGYLDTFLAANGHAGRMAGTFTTQHPGQRVDYIFAWGVPAARLKSGWIEQDRLAKYASDHFPVGAEIVG